MLQVVLPELFEQFEGLTEYEWREYFSLGMFFNDKSEFWFYHMYDNMTNNYDYVLTFFTGNDYLAQVFKDKKSLMQVVESYVDVGQTDVDKKLN